MSRPQRYYVEQILNATTKVVADRDPAGASMARIAAKLKAPTGSICHRFVSRGDLLGEVRLRSLASFQEAFIEQLAKDALMSPAWMQRSLSRSG